MDPHWPYNHHQLNINNNPPMSYSNPIQTTPLLPPAPTVVHGSSSNNPLEQQLRSFWESQRMESEKAVDFRNNSLPLARIKRIMKSDEDVRMISAEAPVLLAKACEMFILELTLRSWVCTDESKRRTLQKADIASALSTTDLFDFLVDIVPRDRVDKPGSALLPPSAPLSRSTVVVWEGQGEGEHCQQQMGQGYYGLGDGPGLNMGLQMPQPPDDHGQVNHDYHDSGGGAGYTEGGWPFMSHDQSAWSTMQRHPSEF